MIKENQQMRTNFMRLVAGAILATLFLPIQAENEKGKYTPIMHSSGELLTASRKTGFSDDTNRYQGGFDFSIPLGKKQNRNRKGCTDLIMSGVGIGFVNSIGEKAPMDVSMGRSLEINWQEAMGLRYNFNRRNSIEIAVGFLWRNYRMTNQYRFQQDNAEVVNIVPYPVGAVPKFSRLHIFQVTLPLLYSHYVKPGWHFTFGPELAFNGNHNKHTATIKTRYSLNGEKYKEKTTDIRVNPVCVNLVAGIRFRAIGVYARYSPCNVLDTNFGPKFQSFSVGLSLWGF